MVARADVVLEWANGDYLFALKGQQIEALEAECMNPETGRRGIGIGAIWSRVMSGDWFMSDITNIIRLGLIGGGLGAVEAKRLVEHYVDGNPLSHMNPNVVSPNCPLAVARAVLAAAFVGIEESPRSEEQQTPES